MVAFTQFAYINHVAGDLSALENMQILEAVENAL